MKKLLMPRARTRDLVTEELPDETLVYDITNDTAHCLNQTTASVWKHCDGEKTLTQIAALLRTELKAPVDERVVQVALGQLSKRSLLAGPFKMPASLTGMSRRQLVRTLGLTGLVAVPVITSLITPTAAQAQSGCIPDGQACSQAGPPCCSATAVCFAGTGTCIFP